MRKKWKYFASRNNYAVEISRLCKAMRMIIIPLPCSYNTKSMLLLSLAQYTHNKIKNTLHSSPFMWIKLQIIRLHYQFHFNGKNDMLKRKRVITQNTQPPREFVKFALWTFLLYIHRNFQQN